MQYIPNSAIESIFLIVIASKYGIFTIIKTLHYQQVFLLLYHLVKILCAQPCQRFHHETLLKICKP